MSKLNIKNLKAVMNQLSECDDQESYDELWKAIQVLNNLGLIDDSIREAAVKEDHRIWESKN